MKKKGLTKMKNGLELISRANFDSAPSSSPLSNDTLLILQTLSNPHYVRGGTLYLYHRTENDLTQESMKDAILFYILHQHLIDMDMWNENENGSDTKPTCFLSILSRSTQQLDVREENNERIKLEKLIRPQINCNRQKPSLHTCKATFSLTWFVYIHIIVLPLWLVNLKS